MKIFNFKHQVRDGFVSSEPIQANDLKDKILSFLNFVINGRTGFPGEYAAEDFEFYLKRQNLIDIIVENAHTHYYEFEIKNDLKIILVLMLLLEKNKEKPNKGKRRFGKSRK